MPIIIPVNPTTAEAFDSITATNTAGRLALPDDLGQVALQTDTGELWRQVASPASVAGSWLQISIDAPSADANNEIVVGTDGKHYYASEPRVFLSDTATAPAAAGAPSLAEILTVAGTTRDAILFYTGDDLPASAPTYVYHIDPAGAVTLLLGPGATATANNRVFLSETVVAPLAAGAPTLAEITTAAGANTDTILYYTSDDLPASVPTYVYHIDQAGVVTLLLSPAGANIYTSDGTIPAGVTRTVSFADNTGGLILDNGAIPIEFHGAGSSGRVKALSFQSDGFIITNATAVANAPNMLQSQVFRIRADATSTGNVTLSVPTNISPVGNRLGISLDNNDVVARTYVLDAAYLGHDGVALGTIIMPANTERTMFFEKHGIDASFILYSDSDGFPGGVADRTVETITQAAHGFTVNQAVYHNGTIWALAQADAAATIAQAIVTSITDVNTFDITTHGVVTVTGHGLTVGNYYWLDQTTAGLLTLTQPVSGVNQSLVHVRGANTLFIDIEQAIEAAASTEVFAQLVQPLGDNASAAVAVTSADTGAIIRLTLVGAQTITLPTGVGIGSGVTFVNDTTDVKTFAAGAGATVTSNGGFLSMDGQYSSVTAVVTATDTWLLVGQLV